MEQMMNPTQDQGVFHDVTVTEIAPEQEFLVSGVSAICEETANETDGTLPQPAEPEYITKLRRYFANMLVRKTAGNTKFFSALSLPSFIRDWLVMRFSDEEGNINQQEVLTYVKKSIPSKAQWNSLLVDMLHNGRSVRFLTKIKIEFDTRNRRALFTLPEFGVPMHKGEAIADWNVVEKNRDYLLSPNEVWGIVQIICTADAKGKDTIFKLVDFQPFCPYTLNLEYYKQARSCFTTEEWIDVLIGAFDYQPSGYENREQKLAVLKRMLPFVEKRLNLIELAPKETGKSYVFSQISKYGWLVSGGSLSRAKMFYDINRKHSGLVSRYDYVAFDEIQSIKFSDPMEMQGVLKGYLESGEFRVGDYRGTGDAGLMLLGNIDGSMMDVSLNMFRDLPEIFHESALLDRFHGFIKGWEIPKMCEELKADDWALNTEYFSEILHQLREDPAYRTVVDRMLELPANAATRDTEAIKRLCTAFVKLLFPNATEPSQINPIEFYEYCLNPAMEMRSIIKTQLGILDPNEFQGTTIPEITIKEEWKQ